MFKKHEKTITLGISFTTELAIGHQWLSQVQPQRAKESKVLTEILLKLISALSRKLCHTLKKLLAGRQRQRKMHFKIGYEVLCLFFWFQGKHSLGLASFTCSLGTNLLFFQLGTDIHAVCCQARARGFISGMLATNVWHKTHSGANDYSHFQKKKCQENTTVLLVRAEIQNVIRAPLRGFLYPRMEFLRYSSDFHPSFTNCF